MKRHTEKGMALVITLMMLAIVTFMAVVFLALSRRERTNVKIYEEQNTTRAMTDAGLARAQAEIVARMVNGAETYLTNSLTSFSGFGLGQYGDLRNIQHLAVASGTIQRARYHYDLVSSKNYIAPGGFVPGSASVANVSYTNNKGIALAPFTTDFLRNIANLQYDPRPPVYVKTNLNVGDDELDKQEFRYYLDLNRNGQPETNGWLALTDPFGRFYDPNGNVASGPPYMLEHFTGDPEWIGVLEKPDFPHSETNRFIGRYAYIILPMGKSLDINYIHNQASYSQTTNLVYVGPNSTNRYMRNQGVGSWELNLAGFLTDFHTNVWKSPKIPNLWYHYTPGDASGLTFRDAAGVLAARMNFSRANLLTAAQGLRPLFALHWNDDFQDLQSDGPFYDYDAWATNGAPIRTGLLFDNDLQDKYWHGMERVDRTAEFPDMQTFFKPGVSSDFNSFLTRYKNAVSTKATNTYDAYAYYRWLAQMGNDSVPALKGKIHLNYTNEPGSISTNMIPWFSGRGPTLVTRAPTLVTNLNGEILTVTNRLTNFFLIAADAMLKASLVTNVYLDNFGRWRTNYTIGGTYFVDSSLNTRPDLARAVANYPVRPDISITNIQIYHEIGNTFSSYTPEQQLMLNTTTNAEYSAALHRILQLAANIYDNMTNRASANTGDVAPTPYYPTVFRPIFDRTATNVSIVNWVSEETADFALRTNNWFRVQDAFHRNGIRWDNIKLYGQPWVIGAKKGWPNFNEMSMEMYIQVTRKLAITKDSPLASVSTNIVDLAGHTRQLFMLGVSNTFGLEAWNSYSRSLNRRIQLDTEVQTEAQIQRRNPINFTNWIPASALVISNRLNWNYPQPYFVDSWAGRERFDTPFDLLVSKLPNGTNIGGVNINSDYRVPNHDMVVVLPDSEYMPNPTPPYYGSFVGSGAIFQPLNTTPDLRFVVTNRIRYVAVDYRANRVIDYVTLDNLVTQFDLTQLLNGVTNAANEVFGSGFNPSDLWNTNLLDSGGLTVGMLKQLQISRGEIPVSKADWQAYSPFSVRYSETNTFREFMDAETDNKNNLTTETFKQAPFAPTRRYYFQTAFQALDPFVHYTESDLRNPFASTNANPIAPGMVVTNVELGRINAGRLKIRDRFPGWAYQDPDLGARSDNWQFPIARLDDDQNQNQPYGRSRFHYRYPNIGVLGQIHRGTPWQTVYLKSAMAPVFSATNTHWAVWSGSYGTHPTNDWKLLSLFTTAPSESAARGLLSVNQTNLAAWSAVLSGVQVITNSTPDSAYQLDPGSRPRWGDPAQNYKDLFIEAGSTQLFQIVRSINDYRSRRPLGEFSYLGEVLGAPALSDFSPYQNHSQYQPLYAFPDEELEAIPRKILSLLKDDEPRMVIYCFGQTLKPAPRSFATDSDFYNLCVNYQVTGEYAAKAVIRVDGELKNPNNPLKTVVESYETLPPFE